MTLSVTIVRTKGRSGPHAGKSQLYDTMSDNPSLPNYCPPGRRMSVRDRNYSSSVAANSDRKGVV